MSKNVAFTICAKNYLAQALTLRQSYKRHNHTDFYIFLSDRSDAENLSDVVLLDEEWIPDWEVMAFKYNVIEFSTSIKPFCINYLFDKGYEEVMYLDPDIYVCNGLNVVFRELVDYSVVLTPHRCFIHSLSDSYIDEQMISGVGIYNLGFILIKNNRIGRDIVEWWKEKLRTQCYNDLSSGLFVDQKWMDFIPGFYPKEVLISNHLGMNVATWNLNERLVSNQDGKWIVKDISGEMSYDLLFFHFSGFSPSKPEQLDKRLPQTDLSHFQELRALVDEYRRSELDNQYEYYSKLRYSFNYYSDKTRVDDLHRKLYLNVVKERQTKDSPFDTNGYVYQYFYTRGFLTGNTRIPLTQLFKRLSGKDKVQKAFILVLYFFGFTKYKKLLKHLKDYCTVDYMNHLLK